VKPKFCFELKPHVAVSRQLSYSYPYVRSLSMTTTRQIDRQIERRVSCSVVKPNNLSINHTTLSSTVPWDLAEPQRIADAVQRWLGYSPTKLVVTDGLHIPSAPAGY